MGWTKVGNVRGPEGPIVPLDSLTDVDVSGAATGALLMKMPDGTWQGRPNTISNLNSLTDVNVPADTPDGQVLRKVAGEWRPSGLIDAEARQTADRAKNLALEALPVDPTSIWLNWRADAAYSAGDVVWVPGPGGEVRDYFASDIDQTGGQAPSRTNTATWTLITGADLVNNPALFHHYLDDLRDVTAPTDTAAGKVLGTTATGQWGPVDVTLNSISDVTITLPAQGEVLTRTPTGWRNLPLPAAPAAPTPSLDSLTDVAVPANTPTGYLLGTTAAGQWGAVTPPATGWGKWVGTQAQYNAITTKDPGVLYVVTD